MSAPRAVRALLPALFFLGWAVVFSFPLVGNLGSNVILSRGGDAWLHLWDLWWLDKALLELGRNPYHTDFILYPTGLNLYYHSLNVFNGLISLPFQHLLGLVPTFNLLVIANLTMDGLAAYWLCLDRTRSVRAALAGGAIFASTPLLGTSLDLAQLDELTVWWVPLYILALWRAIESPGPLWRPGGGRRAALAAGVCLVGASLATWYFTAGLVVFSVFFVPALVWATHRSDGSNPRAMFAALGTAAVKVAAAFVLFALVLSPLLAAMVRERLSGATYMLPSLYTTLYNSADLAALLFPARVDSPINQHGSSVSLGYLPLALALFGLWTGRRKAWPLGIAALVLVVMALGPQLQVMGSQTGIPLPYAALNNVPFVGASRQPLRFLATAGACIALLCSYGTVALVEGRRVGRVGAALVLFLLALLAAEMFRVPRTLFNTSPSAAVNFLRSAPSPGAVLEVPAENWSSLSLLHQTRHERPIIGGYTSRHFPYPFGEAAPGVSELFRADPEPLTGPDILSPSPSRTALFSFSNYDVRYVLVHKRDLATGRFGRLERTLGALFVDANRVYEDDESVVYMAPQAALSGPDNKSLPLVGLGSGWHRVEQEPLHRWTGSNVTDGNAIVWVGIPKDAAGRYRLSMNAYSYKTPRHLTLLLDGRAVFSGELGEAPEDIQLDLGVLPEGNHLLTLQVNEPPENPPGDERKLALGVTRIAFERAEP